MNSGHQEERVMVVPLEDGGGGSGAMEDQGLERERVAKMQMAGNAGYK